MADTPNLTAAIQKWYQLQEQVEHFEIDIADRYEAGEGTVEERREIRTNVLTGQYEEEPGDYEYLWGMEPEEA